MKTITVTSGKGGVGKTAFAVNLALALVQQNKTVTLLDADLGLANVNILFGIVPKYNLLHVIQGEKNIEDVIVNLEITGKSLNLICGAAGISQLANLSHEKINVLIQLIIGTINTDYLIIDTGAGIAHSTLDFVNIADEVIVVTNSDPTTITDAYGIIKSIIITSERKINIVVNRIKTEMEGQKVFQRIQTIIEQFLKFQCNFLGYIFDEDYVSRSIKEQTPYIVAYPKCKASKSILEISKKVI